MFVSMFSIQKLGNTEVGRGNIIMNTVTNLFVDMLKSNEWNYGQMEKTRDNEFRGENAGHIFRAQGKEKRKIKMENFREDYPVVIHAILPCNLEIIKIIQMWHL